MSDRDPSGYYAILGVGPGADARQIKQAYRRRAMDLHPDRNKDPNATGQFQKLQEAIQVLGDPGARARYDMRGLHSGARASASQSSAQARVPILDPIACSNCGAVTAQPRYKVFLEVKGFLLFTLRSGVQGVFCSACAEKKAYRATAVTWLLGWWAIPWGPVYSLHALITNMFGGKRLSAINARLAAHQAWAFAARGNAALARGIALDARALARRAGPDGVEISRQIEKLLVSLGGAGEGRRLKDSWQLLRRPFFVQAGVACAVFGWLGYSIAASPGTSTSHVPAGSYVRSEVLRPPYVSSTSSALDFQSQASDAAKSGSLYRRPETAPNGAPWPAVAGYVSDYPHSNTSGISKVTIDNSANDADVFVKLVERTVLANITARVFFISAGERFTLNRVSPGQYDIRYKDLNTGALARTDPFEVQELETYQGTRYSDITLTLHKVMGGHMQIHELSDGEF